MIVKNTNCHRSDKYILTGKPLNFGIIAFGCGLHKRISTEEVYIGESDTSDDCLTRTVASRNQELQNDNARR